MQVEEFKNHIKSIPISQVIGNFLPLKKRGANHEAVCPFHDDSNPSLKINDSKGIYKCFVCSEAGDAIRFVEQYKGFTFLEALKALAEIFQIQLDLKKKKQNPEFTTALRVLDSASKLYFQYAQKTAPEPYTTFLKSRLLSDETRDKFLIGFAPDGNILTKYLQAKDQENPKVNILSVAMKIGIIREGHSGPYDTFRSRIMFPIWDQYGEVRGFGSRTIKAEQQPKYLNSGESFVFEKKKLCFGLNFAKNSIREKKRVILTEGYMDSIMLHQEGFEEAVAVMGTAMTQEMVNTISHVTSKVYLCFDNDQAGIKASDRASAMFLGTGNLCKYINLAPHKDPDDFLKSEGKITFMKRLDDSLSLIDLKIEKTLSQKFGENTDLKIDALHTVFDMLSPLGKDIKALERIASTSKTLGLKVSPEDVSQSYEDFLREKKVKTPVQLKAARPSSLVVQNEVQQQAKSIPTQEEKISKTDRLILQSLFQHRQVFDLSEFTEILPFALNHNILSFVKQWSQRINTIEAQDGQVKEILSDIFSNENYSENFIKFVYSCLFNNKFPKKDDEEKVLEELKRKLKRRWLPLKKDHLALKRSSMTQKEEIQKIDDEISKLITEYKNF